MKSSSAGSSVPNAELPVKKRDKPFEKRALACRHHRRQLDRHHLHPGRPGRIHPTTSIADLEGMKTRGLSSQTCCNLARTLVENKRTIETQSGIEENQEDRPAAAPNKGELSPARRFARSGLGSLIVGRCCNFSMRELHRLVSFQCGGLSSIA